MNDIPVYEAKNRLSYYLHLSDEQGPIFITNHGKVSYVIQSISEFNEARNKFKEEKTIYDHVLEARVKYGLSDDIDFEGHLKNLRLEEPAESARESEYMEGLLKDE